jgi:O-acetyl-ADP-ribose deacetylase (regulator of RNase III)
VETQGVFRGLTHLFAGYRDRELHGFRPGSRHDAVVELVATQGDITREPADVVVNAANEHLVRGGGVCGAIFAAAGPGLAEACAAVAPCATGDVRATAAFGLRATWIVHAVGPVWRGGGAGEAGLLRSCYRRAITVADGLGARTVAFPAISTGIFGYPLDEATEIAVGTARDAPASLDEIRFVCFDDATLAAYRRELDR